MKLATGARVPLFLLVSLFLSTTLCDYGENLFLVSLWQPGLADYSFGIEVAQLAGVPGEIIHRAKVSHGCSSVLKFLYTQFSRRSCYQAIKRTSTGQVHLSNSYVMQAIIFYLKL